MTHQEHTAILALGEQITQQITHMRRGLREMHDDVEKIREDVHATREGIAGHVAACGARHEAIDAALALDRDRGAAGREMDRARIATCEKELKLHQGKRDKLAGGWYVLAGVATLIGAASMAVIGNWDKIRAFFQ